MNYREKIKEAIKYPRLGNSSYGEWGALRYEQRVLIKRLLDELDDADNLILMLKKENQELKADYGTKAQVERDLLMEENQSLKKQLEERPKEYVFIGNAQNKTRDFINQIIKENQKQNKAIAKAINLIKKSIEQQLENDYLMDRANLMNYNCKLLDILEEVE